MKTKTIDEEWSNFISSSFNQDDSDSESNCDENDVGNATNSMNTFSNVSGEIDSLEMPPEPTNIYISTKSKVAYLNIPIDLKVFWDIPVIPYAVAKDGVIKKQIKSNTTSLEEFTRIQELLKKEIYYEEQIITNINNPSGRIKFKDSRKISIGMSKKDILSYRSKKKSAFYNCFVLILRININGLFKEFHVKVFNTGELDIPGIQSEHDFEIVLKTVIETLQPFIEEKLYYKQISDTVLINSNFNCGFFIDRESLFDILRNKYNIQSIFDPCSYPGIQCKFYYDDIGGNNEEGVKVDARAKLDDRAKLDARIKVDEKEPKTTTRVSFMIFRTGSVLIVGKCNEKILMEIYSFLVNILKTEYMQIRQKNMTQESSVSKEKKKKIHRKKIIVNI